MRLTRLAVRDFRNIGALDIELPPEGVVVIGENGQGKTNLLEAIYYLVVFRSLRGAQDRDLVRFGQTGFFVGGTADIRVTAGFEVRGKRKKITVDGTPVPRLGRAVGRILAVPFSPADRSIVAGAPSERRRYLDVLLSLTAPGYLAALSAMRTALKQRNAALRRGRRDEARAFDQPLAAAAVKVAGRRAQWVVGWVPRFGELCHALGERGEPKLRYDHQGDPPGDPAALCRLLATSLERDMGRGLTSVGPHRDDLLLVLDGRDLRTFGSAGQQRTAAVALRLMEAEALARATGKTPVALCDDVFAELDEDRQDRLFRLIERTLPGQAIITAPRESEVPHAASHRPRWSIRGGTLAA